MFCVLLDIVYDTILLSFTLLDHILYHLVKRVLALTYISQTNINDNNECIELIMYHEDNLSYL